MTTQINLPFITATQDGPKHLDLQLTRAKLEELAHDLLERTVGPTKQALADAGLDASKIDHVVLVGGMTRMPAVQAKVKELIGKDPHKGVNPDEVVAVGAAIQGGVLSGRGQGRPAPRRDAAVARHRDQGRRDDEADRAQHDHPDAQGRDVHDRRGQPAVGRGARPPGRVRDGDVQQDARQVPARRHPAGAARHAADRGRVRHRRERDHQRLGQGPRHGQRAADQDRGRLGPEGGRGPADDQRGRGARRRGAPAARARRRAQRRRGARLPDREVAQGAPRQARRVGRLDGRGPDHGAPRRARVERRRRDQGEDATRSRRRGRRPPRRSTRRRPPRAPPSGDGGSRLATTR